jgi:hypothetical protein
MVGLDQPVKQAALSRRQILSPASLVVTYVAQALEVRGSPAEQRDDPVAS